MLFAEKLGYGTDVCRSKWVEPYATEHFWDCSFGFINPLPVGWIVSRSSRISPCILYTRRLQFCSPDVLRMKTSVRFYQHANINIWTLSVEITAPLYFYCSVAKWISHFLSSVLRPGRQIIDCYCRLCDDSFCVFFLHWCDVFLWNSPERNWCCFMAFPWKTMLVLELNKEVIVAKMVITVDYLAARSMCWSQLSCKIHFVTKSRTNLQWKWGRGNVSISIIYNGC